MVFRSNYFILCLFLSFSNYISAQFPEQSEVYSALTAFPKEKAVVVNSIEKWVIQPIKDSIQVVSTLDRYLVMEDTKESLQEYISYDEFTTVEEFSGTIYTPKKSKSKKYTTQNCYPSEPAAYFGRGVFYDDSRFQTIDFSPYLDSAVLHLHSKKIHKEPHLLPPFYFSMKSPAYESNFSVEVPLDAHIGFTLFEYGTKIICDSIFSESKKIYTFQVKMLEIEKNEKRDLPSSYYQPHVIIWIKDYNKNGKSQTLLNSPIELLAWYKELLSKRNSDVDKISKLSTSIIVDCKTDLEKAEKIFYWVQNNISYVAFEDGYGGFIPRSAGLVCEKKYGDCKDMANLLVELLQAAKLEAYHTWIGSRDIPYLYKDVPTPLSDNHMIAYVEIENVGYFLDATARSANFGQPTSMIQNKEALINHKNGILIKTVKSYDAVDNQKTDRAQLKIDGGKLNGTGDLKLTGYQLSRFKYYYLFDVSSSRMNDFIEGNVEKGNNKFKLVKHEIKGAHLGDEIATIAYDFEIDNYVTISDKYIILNLNLTKNQWAKIDTSKSVVGELNDYRYLDTYSYSLEIPKDYKIDFLPKDITINLGILNYAVKYKLNGNRIEYDKVVEINYLRLDKELIASYNAAILEINKLEKSSISLIKK
jgi:hypothetical protein